MVGLKKVNVHLAFLFATCGEFFVGGWCVLKKELFRLLKICSLGVYFGWLKSAVC